jgi:hypothetical protein
MKKVALLSLILVLLAASVVPAMANDLASNGRGNGVSTGHGNNGGNGNQDKQREQGQEKDQDQLHGRNKSSSHNAHQEHMRMRTPFYLQGTISSLGAEILTVKLTHGNAQVKQYLSTDLDIQTDGNTQFFLITQGDEISGTLGTDAGVVSNVNDDGTPSNRVPIHFEDLQVGQRVAIHGNLVDSIFTARLITVYIMKDNGEPYPEP